MDVQHNTEFHGQLMIQGNVIDLNLKGAVATIIRHATQYLHSDQVVMRRNRNGHFNISINISTEPFNTQPNYGGLDRETYEILLNAGPIETMTQAESEAIEAARPAWEFDDQYKLFRRYQATHSNYITAAPGEIKLLQDSLRAKYGGQTATRLDGSVIQFNDLIIDKRKP